MVLRIDTFEVSHIDRLAQNLLVEGSAEVGVQESTTACQRLSHEVDLLKDSLSDHSSDELEVRKVVAVDGRSLVRLVRLGVGRTGLEESYIISSEKVHCPPIHLPKFGSKIC